MGNILSHNQLQAQSSRFSVWPQLIGPFSYFPKSRVKSRIKHISAKLKLKVELTLAISDPLPHNLVWDKKKHHVREGFKKREKVFGGTVPPNKT